jgi:caa(3)-type oxidase subunit IV
MSNGQPCHPCERNAPSNRRLWLEPVVVWLVLMVILIVNAWSAFLPLGLLTPVVNLVLAAAMLVILALFLMDLVNARPIVRLVATAGLLWAIMLFALTFTDYLSRRSTLPVQTGQSTLQAR